MLKLSKIIFATLLLIWGMVVLSSAQEQEALLKFHRSKYQRLIKSFKQAQKNKLQTNFDVTFYHLNIDVAIQKAFIKGDVLCRFKSAENNLQEIQLNLLHTFQIDSVTGNVSSYSFANDTIYIQLDKGYQSGANAEARIYYQGEPQPIEEEFGFQYHVNANGPKIATVCEPFYSYYWWPCKDGAGDKADSIFLDIAIPDTSINGVQLIAVSNGALENTISAAGKKTFQWRERYPIATYYVGIAISNYKHFQQSYSGKYGENFAIDYYVFPENFEIAQTQVAHQPEVMTFFSDLFGKYPFHREKYAVTQIDSAISLGLENQTNTIIGASWWYAFGLFVHELAHSWFGCMISFEDLHHVWINEGFATYCQALLAEHVGGFSLYKSSINYYKYLDGGTLYYQDVPEGVWEIFGDIIYLKGAYVLHMLRGVLGDSLFFKSLYQYANHQDLMYKHATTEDFKNVCESTTGMNLDFFFDQWVYDEYYPKYEYSFHQNDSTLETTVQIQQTQVNNGRRPVFEMPIQLKLWYKDRSDTIITVWNNQQIQSFSLDLKKPIAFIFFDQDNWILKEAKWVTWTDVADDLTNFLYLKYDLKQNYPNPFNPITTIGYELPKLGFVRLVIYDLQGRQVKTLVNAQQQPGCLQAIWDGTNDLSLPVAAGMYFCRMEAEDPSTSSGQDFMKVIKLALVK